MLCSSPLITPMEDQIERLQLRGLQVALQQSRVDLQVTLEGPNNGDYQMLLFIANEYMRKYIQKVVKQIA